MRLKEKLFPLQKIPYKGVNLLRASSKMQKVLTPFGHRLNPDRWIFIIGCYNSGTSLLAEILARHPKISGLPLEGVSLTDSLPRPEEFGWPRMWGQCLNKIQIDLNTDQTKRVDRIKKQWSIWYSPKKTNLLEKSVPNVPRILFLQKYFYPAYFIYIVRNGYAVSEGIRRKGKPKKYKNSIYNDQYPIELCAEQWKLSDDIIEINKAKISHLIQISYEDFTEDPQTVMQQITNFLDLEPISYRLFEKIWNIHGSKASIQNMNGKSISKLSGEEKRKVEQVAGKTLEKYFYI